MILQAKIFRISFKIQADFEKSKYMFQEMQKFTTH